MEQLGWDSCDIIIVCGDAYVDHPSFGMAVIGRFLESQGYRVGIIAQPDWRDAEAFKALGKPNLFFAVSAGNMDSMINRYTADRKIRSNDAYTPNDEGGKRPDRAVLVYTQRCREAFKEVPVVIGGIEASLRRLAHYDYWSDTVRRSVLIDSKADLLLYGNAERAIAEVAFRASRGEHPKTMTNIRGTAVALNALPSDWAIKDSTRFDTPGKIDPIPNPYETEMQGPAGSCSQAETKASDASMPDDVSVIRIFPAPGTPKSFVMLPSYEKVKSDPVMYAHASRVFHLETNPSNAHVLVQKHGDRYLWVNQPPVPLDTDELDSIFDLQYQRRPHPSYGDAKIPAYEMIRFSINIMRGCFGGCSFCSITEHEGRVIQSRSEESVLREVERIRDRTPGFTGIISDLGGPTANMYQLNCKTEEIHASCRRLSCVFPTICKNLVTDQRPTTELYRRVRQVKGVKKVLIASGLRYDLAVLDPEYVEELVTHHVGGYLKIAPEHTESGPLSKMMKPGIGTYQKFKEMFEFFTRKAGKEQFLIPYFISAHPGTTDEDMMNLALWLKQNGFRADQVQNFYPSPMCNATTMYHTERNPLHRLDYKSEKVAIPKGDRQRRLHKAYLRYHDPKNWPLIRESLKAMGKAHLIGRGKQHLVPPEDAKERHYKPKAATPGKVQKGSLLTQHSGLPPSPHSGREAEKQKRNKPGTRKR